MIFITARKQSVGQGNVFTRVCHSVQRGGSAHRGGGGLPPGRSAYGRRGVCIQGWIRRPPPLPESYKWVCSSNFKFQMSWSFSTNLYLLQAGTGAFFGWKVAVLVEDQHKALVYRRLETVYTRALQCLLFPFCNYIVPIAFSWEVGRVSRK